MLKKILLSLVVLFSLCINVCAEDLSYNFSQKIINNTGKYAIVKNDGALYFSGDRGYVELNLEKGSKITLLRWNSYKDIKPLAKPTDYTLYEINFVCEGAKISTEYGFSGCEIKYPKVPEKNGYEVKWTVTEKNDYTLIAQAEYELCEYDVLFYADEALVAKRTYNINNQIITEPAVPKKEGYNGKWESYSLTYGDVIVNAVYTPIEYTVTFEADNEIVVKKNFSVENMYVEAPAVSEKAGYTAKWEGYELSLKNITVKAVYELIEYSAEFVADGSVVSNQKFNVENMTVAEPAVPEKAGYTGKWESYELKLSDVTVNAVYTPIEYKVTFKAENFTETKVFTVENMKVTEPNIPEKTGHTAKWEDYTLGLSDLTVNAVYSPCKYTITFDCTDEKITVTYGEKYPTLPIPENKDVSVYFDGWYMESKLVTEGDKVEITGDYCLTAKWTKKPVYKIVYSGYYQDGTSLNENVIEGQKAIKPENPEKQGYSFVNWQTATGEVYDFEKAVTKNVTLYPKWEIVEYTVTFVADGKTVSVGNYTVENKNITVPEVPEKKGYTAKWEEYELTYGNVNVDAVYTPVQYKVTFMADGVEVSVQNFTVEDMSITEPNVPEKVGYTHEWEEYELTLADTVVNAVYTPCRYIISFDCVDGEKEVIYGEKYPILPTPENDDVSRYFIGWYIGETLITEGNKVEITEDSCLVARWANKPVYEVVYNGYYQDGTSKVEAVIEGERAVVPSKPTKTGYTFVNWQTKDGEIYDFDASVTENINLYANWEIVEHTANFVADGEIVSSRTFNIENMTVAEPAVPRKAGYTGKWESYELKLSDVTVNAVYTPIEYKVTFKAENFTETKAFTVENMKVTEPNIPEKTGHTAKWEDYTLGLSDLTVNAVYSPCKYTITFDCTDEKITVTYGEKYPTLPIPENKDVSVYFDGWYMESKLVTEGDKVEITGDYCLTAKWTKKPVYKIVYSGYYQDGTSLNENVIEGQKAIKPENPEKQGYSFVNWQTATGEVYDFEKAVTKNVTLYPKWEIVEYTVTFVADGVVVGVKTYNIEYQKVTPPAVPNKTGYTKSWESYTLTCGNVVVNAVYTPITYYVYFMDETGNNLIATVSYTLDDKKINEPEVPAKEGQIGAWQSYSLSGGTVMVYPVYSLINYKVTFVADGKVVDEQTYTVTNKRVTEPNVPAKTGYSAVWESYSLNLSDITVRAVYTPVEYTVTFMADGQIIDEEKYTVENMMVYSPSVPEKAGYTAKWEDFSMNLSNITVNAIYTPIVYTITFTADGSVVSTQSYTVENMFVTEPTVPEKTGYTGKWEAYSVELKNKNVRAVYTLNEYKATFVAEGKTVSEQIFSIENMKVTEPSIPAKNGYTSKWENYSLKLEDITINAVYDLINYSIQFVADGGVVSSQSFNAENMNVTEPAVPEKTGYTGKWQSYSMGLKNITVKAVYTPISYKATFVVDGVEISSTDYTVESGTVTEPKVPEKEWYDGEWETYNLDAGGVTINAVYTLATYTICFKADGKEIGTQTYDKNNQTVTLPSIPEKSGYRAIWERYEVVPGGMVVNARYISKATDEENAEELYHYTNLVTDLSGHIETGTKRMIIENIVKVGQRILEDIEYGIIIEENYIKNTYTEIIKETQALNATLPEKERINLKRTIATTIKEETTYDYFLDFYEKYF